MNPLPHSLKHLAAPAAALLLAAALAGCEYDELYDEPGYYGGGYSAPVGPGYGYPPPPPPPPPPYGGGYYYGPRPGRPGGWRPPVYSRVSVLSARWESERRSADVTDIVQDMLDRGVDTFRAENRTFGIDPDKGRHKRLYVRYRVRGETRTLMADEGDTVRIR